MSTAYFKCDRLCAQFFTVNGGIFGVPTVAVKEMYFSENWNFGFTSCYTFSYLIHSLYPPRIVSTRSIAIMFFTLALPMLTLFLPIHSALAPQYDDGYTPCAETTAYKDLSSTPKYTGGWQMTGAPPVTSDPISAASLTATYSESIGVTITEGFSLGAKLWVQLWTYQISFQSKADVAEQPRWCFQSWLWCLCGLELH